MVLEWSHCLNSEMMACLLERKDPFLLDTTLSSQGVSRTLLLTVSTEAPDSPAERQYRLPYFTAEDIGDPAVSPGSTQPIVWQSRVRTLSRMACSSRDTVLSRPLVAQVLSLEMSCPECLLRFGSLSSGHILSVGSTLTAERAPQSPAGTGQPEGGGAACAAT